METKTMELKLNNDLLKGGASVYRALNHPLRQRILQMIHRKGRVSVTIIYSTLRLEQSVTSQHLAILRKAGVVNIEREGIFIFYSVNYDKVNEIHEATNRLLR